jgi:hypothetical protein
MCDLLDWALTQANGNETWRNTKPRDWDEDSQRFFDALTFLDERIASEGPLGCPAGTIFQGAIADALTHTGQIAMLRRLAGARVRAENYSRAKIASGQTTKKQPKPVAEYGK